MTELRTVALADIRPSLNARGRVGDVDELALSIKVLGLQKPLIVIPRADGDGYDILDGHRRHAAALKAGLTRVDAIVRDELGEAGRIQAQLAMETHAKQFDPMSEARALHALMFRHNLTREQISRAVGRPPAWVRDRIALVHLTAPEQAQLQDGRLSVSEALHRLKVRRDALNGTPPAAAPAARVRPAAPAPARPLASGGLVKAPVPSSESTSAQLRRVVAERDELQNTLDKTITAAEGLVLERDRLAAELASARQELDHLRARRLPADDREVMRWFAFHGLDPAAPPAKVFAYLREDFNQHTEGAPTA